LLFRFERLTPTGIENITNTVPSPHSASLRVCDGEDREEAHVEEDDIMDVVTSPYVAPVHHDDHNDRLHVYDDLPEPDESKFAESQAVPRLDTSDEIRAEIERLRAEIVTLQDVVKQVSQQERNELLYQKDLSARATKILLDKIVSLEKVILTLRETISASSGAQKVVSTVSRCDLAAANAVKHDVCLSRRDRSNRFLEKMSDAEVQLLTSIPWKGWFYCFGKILRSVARTLDLHERTISFENQVLFVFEKLRRDQPYRFLAFDWGLSKNFLCETFNKLLPILRAFVLLYQESRKIPTVDEIQAMGVPKWFLSFPGARFIIDCTDFPCETPGDISLKRKMYSSYKNFTSAKVLLVMLPSGYLAEVSLPFPGRVSDDDIAVTCDFVKLCETGDLILSDKGFRFPERLDTLKSNVQVVTPNFLRKNEQMDEQEIRRSREIASARVHVERSVHSLKRFHILMNIHHNFRRRLHEMLDLCGFLTNLQPPLFADLEPNMPPDDLDE
jgi:hypothetical protein